MDELHLIWVLGTGSFALYVFYGLNYLKSAYPASVSDTTEGLVRMLVTLGSFANALAHILAICWHAVLGERDLSFLAGPFTKEGQQIKNLLAIPIAIVWLIYTYFVMGSKSHNYKLQKENWRRFLFPVIFLIIGWLKYDVYPSFFLNDQFKWPYLYGRSLFYVWTNINLLDCAPIIFYAIIIGS